MYQIENIFDIMIMYRIDKYNQVVAVKKATKSEMYDFLLHNTYISFNPFTLEDEYYCRYLNCRDSFALEEYFFTDGAGRNINISDLKDEIFELYDKAKAELTAYKPRKRTSPYYFKYRNGPVPHTKKTMRGGSCCTMRHVFEIYKDYANPEMKDYVRNRGDVPYWWDDKFRTIQRSWKYQKKCRHQWQIHERKN